MTEYCDGGIAQNVVSRAAGHRRTATAASATASTPMPSLVSAVASTNSKRRLKRATTPFIVSIAEPEVTQVHEHVYYMTDPEADSDNEPIPGASIVDTLSSSSSSSSSDSDNDDNDSANSLDYYVRRRTIKESANAFNVDSEQSDDNNSGGGKKNKHNLADDSSDNSEPIANLSSKFAMKLAKLNTNPAVLAHGATNNANQGSTTQAATNSTSPILPATSMRCFIVISISSTSNDGGSTSAG
ncbi:hypothetical protein BDF22DRAFT_656108 [Syncephalis plumigaleata]|nr:hypothetical protein BDF22DRAFT_656108 [Syncephalis plumigaleata]